MLHFPTFVYKQQQISTISLYFVCPKRILLHYPMKHFFKLGYSYTVYTFFLVNTRVIYLHSHNLPKPNFSNPKFHCHLFLSFYFHSKSSIIYLSFIFVSYALIWFTSFYPYYSTLTHTSTIFLHHIIQFLPIACFLNLCSYEGINFS